MAAQPILDLDTIDLDRTLVDRDEIYRVCKQAGNFRMLDAIVHLDLENDLIVGYKNVDAEEWWARDHIPGRPIFPGALQVEAAAQLCSFDFMKRNPQLVGQFVGFAGMNATRFRGMVEPPSRLVIAGSVAKVRRSMFTYRAQGFVEGKLVLETEIMGVIV